MISYHKKIKLATTTLFLIALCQFYFISITYSQENNNAIFKNSLKDAAREIPAGDKTLENLDKTLMKINKNPPTDVASTHDNTNNVSTKTNNNLNSNKDNKVSNSHNTIINNFSNSLSAEATNSDLFSKTGDNLLPQLASSTASQTQGSDTGNKNGIHLPANNAQATAGNTPKSFEEPLIKDQKKATAILDALSNQGSPKQHSAASVQPTLQQQPQLQVGQPQLQAQVQQQPPPAIQHITQQPLSAAPVVHQATKATLAPAVEHHKSNHTNIEAPTHPPVPNITISTLPENKYHHSSNVLGNQTAVKPVETVVSNSSNSSSPVLVIKDNSIDSSSKLQKFEMYMKPVCMAAKKINDKQLKRIQMQLVQFSKHSDNNKLGSCFSHHYGIESSNITTHQLEQICESRKNRSHVYNEFASCLNLYWVPFIDKELERILVNRINCSKAHRLSPKANSTSSFSINKLSHEDKEMSLLEKIVAEIAENELKGESNKSNTTIVDVTKPGDVKIFGQVNTAPTTHAPNTEIKINVNQIDSTKQTTTSSPVTTVKPTASVITIANINSSKQDSGAVSNKNITTVVAQQQSVEKAPVVVVIADKAQNKSSSQQTTRSPTTHLPTTNSSAPVKVIIIDQQKDNNQTIVKKIPNVEKNNTSILQIDLKPTTTTTSKPKDIESVLIQNAIQTLTGNFSKQVNNNDGHQQHHSVIQKSKHDNIEISNYGNIGDNITVVSVDVSNSSKVSNNDNIVDLKSLISLVTTSAPKQTTTGAVIISVFNVAHQQTTTTASPKHTTTSSFKLVTTTKNANKDEQTKTTAKPASKKSTPSPTKQSKTTKSAPPSKDKKGNGINQKTSKSSTQSPTTIEVIHIKSQKGTSKPKVSKSEVVVIDSGKGDGNYKKAKEDAEGEKSSNTLATILVTKQKSESSTAPSTQAVSDLEKAKKAIKDLMTQRMAAKTNEHEHESKLHQLEHDRQMIIDPVGHTIKHERYEKAKEMKLAALRLQLEG